jgi:hypothetical protein
MPGSSSFTLSASAFERRGRPLHWCVAGASTDSPLASEIIIEDCALLFNVATGRLERDRKNYSARGCFTGAFGLDA